MENKKKAMILLNMGRARNKNEIKMFLIKMYNDKKYKYKKNSRYFDCKLKINWSLEKLWAYRKL